MGTAAKGLVQGIVAAGIRLDQPARRKPLGSRLSMRAIKNGRWAQPTLLCFPFEPFRNRRLRANWFYQMQSEPMFEFYQVGSSVVRGCSSVISSQKPGDPIASRNVVIRSSTFSMRPRCDSNCLRFWLMRSSSPPSSQKPRQFSQ